MDNNAAMHKQQWLSTTEAFINSEKSYGFFLKAKIGF